MATQAIEQSQFNVPDLVRTPALEISAADVSLPRLYIAQMSSKHTIRKEVEFGSLYTAMGQDDSDPQVLWEYQENSAKRKGVLVHVVGLRKGKSMQDSDGELVLYDFNDPDAPPEAWTTYNYAIVLPEVDAEIPYKWLLTRSGTPAARQLNTVLKKNEGRGPAYAVAFEAKTSPRENKKGNWFVPDVRQVEAKQENVAIAEQLAVMMGDTAPDVGSAGEQPAI